MVQDESKRQTLLAHFYTSLLNLHHALNCIFATNPYLLSQSLSQRGAPGVHSFYRSLAFAESSIQTTVSVQLRVSFLHSKGPHCLGLDEVNSLNSILHFFVTRAHSTDRDHAARGRARARPHSARRASGIPIRIASQMDRDPRCHSRREDHRAYC